MNLNSETPFISVFVITSDMIVKSFAILKNLRAVRTLKPVRYQMFRLNMKFHICFNHCTVSTGVANPSC